MTPLEEANRRLREMQAARRQQRIEQGLPVDATLIDQGQPMRTAVPDVVQALPDHLGWESDLVTRAIRRQTKPEPEAAPAPAPAYFPPPAPIPPPIESDAVAAPRECAVVLYPSLSAVILKQDLEAPARIYFALRSLDREGRGWYRLSETRKLLAMRSSPWYAVSRRQLHNLLATGEGIFWQQEGGGVWLRSPARVAAALGVYHLAGRAVLAPAAEFLGNVADVRAHLYASFISGRPHADMPISRETITAVTGVDERTQKAYERRVKISATANFCIGQRLDAETTQEQAWRNRGKGAFELTDKKGMQGKPGEKYLAWQLPNSYHDKHETLPRGKQRRVNRELKVLLTQTAAGNSGVSADHPRRYYPNGGQAAKQHSRTRDPVLWRRAPGQRTTVWHELA
jgi:hypothetical protein